MIRIRTYSGKLPLFNLDVLTIELHTAAEEASTRAARYGWDNVSLNLNDGTRPFRGPELLAWISRHYPDLV